MQLSLGSFDSIRTLQQIFSEKSGTRKYLRVLRLVDSRKITSLDFFEAIGFDVSHPNSGILSHSVSSFPSLAVSQAEPLMQVSLFSDPLVPTTRRRLGSVTGPPRAPDVVRSKQQSSWNTVPSLNSTFGQRFRPAEILRLLPSLRNASMEVFPLYSLSLSHLPNLSDFSALASVFAPFLSVIHFESLPLLRNLQCIQVRLLLLLFFVFLLLIDFSTSTFSVCLFMMFCNLLLC